MKIINMLANRKMNRRLGFVLILLFLGFQTGFRAQNAVAQSTAEVSTPFVQEPTLFSLEETIQLAKEQSPLARSARYSLIASQWRYKSFRADLLPELSLSGDAPNYRRTLSRRLTETGDIQFISTNQSDASLDVQINQNILWTGGSLSVSSGITRLGIFSGENTYL
jgi:outer membrane protein TolC